MLSDYVMLNFVAISKGINIAPGTSEDEILDGKKFNSRGLCWRVELKLFRGQAVTKKTVNPTLSKKGIRVRIQGSYHPSKQAS